MRIGIKADERFDRQHNYPALDNGIFNMGLKKVWIDTLYKVATGSRKVRNIFTPIGAFIFCFFTFIFVFVALYVDRTIGLASIFPSPFKIILAIPFFLLAAFLIGWSVQSFFIVKGTPVPFNPPPQLVTTGPYRYTRNPMLTGVFSLLFGFGVFFGSISLLFIFTPLFIYLNYWELKSIEEPELEKRLGEDYIQYRQKTPMFFPDLGGVFRKRGRG
jgi:protein-S-isoprenylcysteine O-methyltransferase Ste14